MAALVTLFTFAFVVFLLWLVAVFALGTVLFWRSR